MIWCLCPGNVHKNMPQSPIMESPLLADSDPTFYYLYDWENTMIPNRRQYEELSRIEL